MKPILIKDRRCDPMNLHKRQITGCAAIVNLAKKEIKRREKKRKGD